MMSNIPYHTTFNNNNKNNAHIIIIVYNRGTRENQIAIFRLWLASMHIIFIIRIQSLEISQYPCESRKVVYVEQKHFMK